MELSKYTQDDWRDPNGRFFLQNVRIVRNLDQISRKWPPGLLYRYSWTNSWWILVQVQNFALNDSTLTTHFDCRKYSRYRRSERFYYGNCLFLLLWHLPNPFVSDSTAALGTPAAIITNIKLVNKCQEPLNRLAFWHQAKSWEVPELRYTKSKKMSIRLAIAVGGRLHVNLHSDRDGKKRYRWDGVTWGLVSQRW